ncbi:MAG: methyltransferase type 12 [Acidobacteria bacterium]|nr:MAG: methyltransferase type 12 [Acidobacteriota bacterium]
MDHAVPAAGRQPSPERIFQMLNAYQQTAALKAAIELDLFTAIGEGNVSPQALAKRCSAAERGVRILCDYLVVHGMLDKNGKAYGLTSDAAAFLDRRAPAYQGTLTKFLNSPDLMDGFKDLAAAVRKGGTVLKREAVAPQNPIWVEFARSMAPMMALPAELVAKSLGAEAGHDWKVLDIAAGHGLFGITIAKHNPRARIVALDWAKVLEVATENARKAGVADRHSTIIGSAFEADFGNGYDLVLLTNFLHHFDEATNIGLLMKVHAALKPGGRVATLEFVPNEDRVSPPVPATFSLIMLGETEHGDAYTFSELDRMFSKAGFVKSEIHQLPPTPEQLILSHKQDGRGRLSTAGDVG